MKLTSQNEMTTSLIFKTIFRNKIFLKFVSPVMDSLKDINYNVAINKKRRGAIKMITNCIKDIYICFGGSVSNTTIYQEAAISLEVANDEDFRHTIRGIQQNLKRDGLLVRIGYGMWQYNN